MPDEAKYTDNDIDFLRLLSADDLPVALDLIRHSKAQFRQDLFVLSRTGFMKNGFFVEFGAADGLELSNTWLLEKQFGWRGILAEPARGCHSALRRNRQCAIDTACIWKQGGEKLVFNEVPDTGLSTIDSFSAADRFDAMRAGGTRYEVDTLSLLDLLRKHDAPKRIDYLSIDTEGSEFDILSAFDFSAYDIRIITCEHNHTPRRGRIRELLSRHGYVRVMEDVSQVDDWYVRESPA